MLDFIENMEDAAESAYFEMLQPDGKLKVQPMKLTRKMRSRTLQEDKAVNKFFDKKCRTVPIPVKEKGER